MIGGSTGRDSTTGSGGEGRRDEVDEAGEGVDVTFFFRENRPIARYDWFGRRIQRR